MQTNVSVVLSDTAVLNIENSDTDCSVFMSITACGEDRTIFSYTFRDSELLGLRDAIDVILLSEKLNDEL